MSMNEQHIHFIGIGGYGMSAIARVMLEMGYQVSGSDVTRQDLTDSLVSLGAKVYIGHAAKHVQGANLVVYSTALAKDNVEISAAQALHIPVIHRAQMLARILNAKRGIAIAGAHGKTTTSSMIALMMERCGLDPTYIIGGEIMNIGSNARAGKGEFVVAEADESDASFLHYHPELAVVTNIEADHLENYNGDFENLKKAYIQFLNQVKSNGHAVVCYDDPVLSGLLSEVRGKYITYGTYAQVDYRAVRIQLGDRRAEFDLTYKENFIGHIELSIPGHHNVLNATAAAITGLQAGLTMEQIAPALKEFQGAKRRFQVLGDAGGILIIDDYAHHPTEIIATIAAAKATGRRIIAVFQPQRYTRTFYLLDQFSRSFAEADEVVIVDIYSPAGEQQIEGVTATRLAELIRERSNSNVRHLATKEQVCDFLKGFVQSGDAVLTMGAGDIWKVAKELANEFRKLQ